LPQEDVQRIVMTRPMSVCLLACAISENTLPNFNQILEHVACGCGSVLW